MDLLSVLFIVAIAWNVRIVKPITAFNDQYLSIDCFNQLRGLFCIWIVFCHIAGSTTGGIVFHSFSRYGYLAVAVFFFISGYGLIKQYQTKDTYLDTFVTKKFRKIVIPYIICNIIYYFYSYLSNNPIAFFDILNSWFNGNPIVKFSWFIIDLLYMYAVFYISAKFLKKALLIILCEIVFCIAITFIWHYQGYDFYWFKSNFALVIGMGWAFYEKKITSICKKNNIYWPMIISLFFVFLLIIVIKKFLPTGSLNLMCSFASTTIFPIIAILACQKIRLNSPILNFIRIISMEIYLIHGLFLSLFLPIANVELLYAVTVILCSIISAISIHKLFIKMRLK